MGKDRILKCDKCKLNFVMHDSNMKVLCPHCGKCAVTPIKKDTNAQEKQLEKYHCLMPTRRLDKDEVIRGFKVAKGSIELLHIKNETIHYLLPDGCFQTSASSEHDDVLIEA
jgi:uncharacterized Zn finger protein (UPF0148 family)